MREESKEGLLFLKKKKQKNFYLRRDLAPLASAPAVSKSFFAARRPGSFFSKKEALTCLFASLLLTGCSSERHFAADTLWPFGNPNRPIAASETAQRALGHAPAVTPIAPQAGNVWPGAVQPVPTIADEEKAMNEPLGDAYAPSLPSPYPPGTAPPPDADLGMGALGAPGTQTFATPDDTGSGANGTQDLAPLTAPLPSVPSPEPTPMAPVPGSAVPGAPSSGGSVGGSAGAGQ